MYLLKLTTVFFPVTGCFIEANKESLALRGVRRVDRCCSGRLERGEPKKSIGKLKGEMELLAHGCHPPHCSSAQG